MKKTLLTIIASIFIINAIAQDETKVNEIKQDTSKIDKKLAGKNEISTNLLMLGFIGVADISYERLFDNSGIGISASMDIGQIGYNFAFIPYYRVYLGKKKTSGFFIEGNAVFYNAEKMSWGHYLEDGTYIQDGRIIENQFGFGVAAGGKFLNKSGFVGDLFGGVAKLFGGNNADDYFPRIGITLGKRF